MFLAFAACAAEQALEYKIKAGFLFNFIRFVEWPAAAAGVPSSPVVIGVLADDPAGPVLQHALAGKVVNNRALEVRLLKESADGRACQLLFLGRAQESRITEILRQLNGAPVLTVSEVGRFAQRGGMLNFVRKEESFRFEINVEAVESAGLKISSRLSGMATIVNTVK